MNSEDFRPLREIGKDAKPLDLIEVEFPCYMQDTSGPIVAPGTERVTGYFIKADSEKVTLTMFQKLMDPREHVEGEMFIDDKIHKRALEGRLGVIDLPFSVELHGMKPGSDEFYDNIDLTYRIRERFVPESDDAIDHSYIDQKIIEKPKDWDEE
jgi:hypothetical protein